MNFLFLMTDQHRVDTLGAYGNQLARTPHLDELARTGTRFFKGSFTIKHASAG